MSRSLSYFFTLWVLVLALGCSDGPRAFTDHTVPRLSSVSDFDARSLIAFGTRSSKFVITSFDDPASRDVRFYDSQFYRLHDEWYWFRLLNGQRIPGDDVIPVSGRSFATVADLTLWAHAEPSLPLGLQFIEGRLYSTRFYHYALGASRRYGIGSLLHIPPRNGAPDRWAFELEFSDPITHPQLTVFFETLSSRLPAEIGSALRFLVRSQHQESLAVSMERSRLAYYDRVLRYSDFVVPGAREVYSDGITAGRLRVLRQGDPRGASTPDDLVILESIPDLLPPAAGLITAVPQTPLSHINLLARNRGIPNVHIAGVLDDGDIGQLARAYAPVILFAQSPDRVQLVSITEAQFGRYGALLSRPERTLSIPDLASVPYTLDLTSLTATNPSATSAILGGKCTGMIALLTTPGLELPDRPQCLTVRAYAEHLAPLRERIAGALNSVIFQGESRAREIVLEGEASFRGAHPMPTDTAYVNSFLQRHGAVTTLGSLARSGGIRRQVEAAPIAQGTLRELTARLRETYANLSVTQGLRFRSSSNVEDIEGFNGAGLYQSFTGFLDPEAQPGASDRTKTVERAIQRVWSSYWSFEAFEERRLERIDHLSGSMAVLIAPRFDDGLERSTGVCTLTLHPSDTVAEALVVNVQAGAESVANPDPAVLPEIDRVERDLSGVIRITRARRSSLSPSRELLGDEALVRLFTQTSEVARRWIERENLGRPGPRRARSLTLDYEFHDMSPGWPAMRSGELRPARLVLKQVRTLEPGPRVSTEEALAWPIPRDVFVRLRRVSDETCELSLPSGVGVTTTTLRVLSDPSLAPDLGYGITPLDALITVRVQGDLSVFGFTSGQSFSLNHTEFERTVVLSARSYRLTESAAARVGIDTLGMDPNGEFFMARGSDRVSGSSRCTEEIRFAGPRDYLLSLLPRG